MNTRTWWWSTLVLSTLLAAGAAAEQKAEDFVAVAGKLDKAATIDGVAGKDEYPARTLALKQTPERDAIQGEAPSTRVAHDGKTLYVAITVPLKNAAKISKGEGWGTDDGAEICFRDASGAKPGHTFIVHGFASGKHECTTDAGAPDEAVGKLDKAVKFAAKVDAQSWTGEWAIPFEAVGIAYKAGTTLGFNLGGWRAENGEWFVWRGAQGATYELDNGGKLTLE
jgi:hypothetical protein